MKVSSIVVLAFLAGVPFASSLLRYVERLQHRGPPLPKIAHTTLKMRLRIVTVCVMYMYMLHDIVQVLSKQAS